MFGTIKNEKQSRLAADNPFGVIMDKLYERINEHGLRPRLREP